MGAGRQQKWAPSWLAGQTAPPPSGAIRARRDVGLLGSAEELAIRLTQVIHEAGWGPIPLAEVLGGEVLKALKRMRPWEKALCDARTQLIGDIERNRTRIRYQEPWECGLAVRSGAVEGACKHVIQSRFKRAGMR